MRGKVYVLVLQHCMSTTTSKLKSQTLWKTAEDDADAIPLLQMIRDTTHGVELEICLSNKTHVLFRVISQ